MLVLFDVDGTLTATGALDAEVYERTFRTGFGDALPSAECAEYESPTDRGIAEEAVRRLGLDRRRIPEFEMRFVEELRRELGRRGAQAIPGAVRVLDRLAAAGHAVAVATGAWEEAARTKLAAAGIELGECILVGSDFHIAREHIVREAERRCGSAERTVYVGDGIWDVRVARALHMPFLGVDPEETGMLRREGVRHVIRDYRDFAAISCALRAACVPDV